jgi:serine/threonine-protein kinase
LPEYKILNSLGQGMTSQVYRAQDPSGRVVAIKELLPEHRKDPKRIQGLAREVALMRDIRHPNTVSLLDFDRARFRMILEYLPVSLRAVMQKQPFHYEKRLGWSLDVTEALIHLHDRKLVHKDIKPENIFISEGGKAKLGDFGFAEREPGPLGRWMKRLRKPRVQGTLAYLSPEQATQRPLTTKSDIFSWGGVLYELFAGRLPFKAPPMGGGDPMGMVDQILTADPRPPRELNGILDKELEVLILDCLSKSRRKRPSALYVKGVLKRLMDKIG